jgi:pSer/pThr/pTyr-binding forkhead associated (FHA) protein
VESDVHSRGAKPRALVQVIGTDEAYSIVGQVDLGRSLDNDIVVNDTYVSRKHARITLEGSDFAIEDLGTTNGTYVNGTNIKGKGKVILKEGDEVKLGQTKFKFTLHISE